MRNSHCGIHKSIIRAYTTWAAPAGWPEGDAAAPLCPGCPLSRREKNYMCPLHPSRPLSQRKVYVKIHEMCQNTA